MVDYERHLVSAWDMSNINPPDIGWKNNGNHGVGTGLVAATDIVEGIVGGRAIRMNGLDEFITVADAASIRFGANPFTVSVWISTRMNLTDTVGSILDKFDQANKQGWGLYVGHGSGGNTRRVMFSINNEDSDNAWVEVAPKLGAETRIYSLAVYNGKLYGGTYPNGKLYEWNDVDAWVEVAPKLGAETYIFALAVYNGKFYGGTRPNGKLHEWASGANATYDYELTPGWHHVAAVKDTDAVYLYIDGEPVASQASNAYDTDNTEDLLIGSGFKDQFNGVMDSVRVYSAALTPLQVRDLYERTRKGILR